MQEYFEKYNLVQFKDDKMDEYGNMPLNNQLAFALYACSKELVKLYQSYLKRIGLTFTQYICLLSLWESGSMGIKTLCEKTMLDTGTITPLLKKLESKGLLLRIRSTVDERAVSISLTEEGERLKEKALGIPQKVFSRTGLSIAESIQLKQQLFEILDKIKSE